MGTSTSSPHCQGFQPKRSNKVEVAEATVTTETSEVIGADKKKKPEAIDLDERICTDPNCKIWIRQNLNNNK